MSYARQLWCFVIGCWVLTSLAYAEYDDKQIGPSVLAVFVIISVVLTLLALREKLRR